MADPNTDRYVVDEDKLENGVEGRGISCSPTEGSKRFYDCSIQTVNPSNPARKNIVPKVDAINVKREADVEVRGTRVASSSARAERGESIEVTGTCRPSNHTERGSFCEIVIEEAE